MWWVILSVCIATIVILIALLHKVMKLYFEMCEVFDELDFFDGNSQVFPQKDIERKYENVTLLYNIQKGTEYSIIVDTSKYEKNNLIGLTYLVPAADYDKLANDVMRNVKRKMKEEAGKDADVDFIEETVQDTMDGVLIPLCDVYQLKNGKWVWRSKFEKY